MKYPSDQNEVLSSKEPFHDVWNVESNEDENSIYTTEASSYTKDQEILDDLEIQDEPTEEQLRAHGILEKPYNSKSFFRAIFTWQKRSVHGVLMLVSALWMVVVSVISFLIKDGGMVDTKNPCDTLWCPYLTMDGYVHSYFGIAVIMLMTFRANTAYQRYYEARNAWSYVTSLCRDLCRTICTIIGDEKGIVSVTVKDDTIIYLKGFAFALDKYLKKDLHDVRTSDFVPQEDDDLFSSVKNQPLYFLTKLTCCVRTIRENSLLLEPMIAHVNGLICSLSDTLNTCERIRSTPVPLSYVVHLRTFMLLWILLLPFALVQTLGWLTIPVGIIIVYGMASIEWMVVEVEDPFGNSSSHLPIDFYCSVINRNLDLIRDISKHAKYQVATRKTI